jgi:hypothetical protein
MIRRVRALSSLLSFAFATSSLGACGATGSTTPSASAARAAPDARPVDSASAPIAPPRPSITGCVESRELKEYVRALDAQRRDARRAALAALGATDEERQGVFGKPSGPDRLDATFDAGGRRFAVAAQLAPGSEPRTTLARQGARLRRIDERPRAHPSSVRVCGVQRCSSGQGGRRDTERPPAVRPLLIELGPGEAWGEPLELRYDYWWASVSYDRAEPCEPPACGPGPCEPSSAATATP